MFGPTEIVVPEPATIPQSVKAQNLKGLIIHHLANKDVNVYKVVAVRGGNDAALTKRSG